MPFPKRLYPGTPFWGDFKSNKFVNVHPITES